MLPAAAAPKRLEDNDACQPKVRRRFDRIDGTLFDLSDDPVAAYTILEPVQLMSRRKAHLEPTNFEGRCSMNFRQGIVCDHNELDLSFSSFTRY